MGIYKNKINEDVYCYNGECDKCGRLGLNLWNLSFQVKNKLKIFLKNIGWQIKVKQTICPDCKNKNKEK